MHIKAPQTENTAGIWLRFNFNSSENKILKQKTLHMEPVVSLVLF